MAIHPTPASMLKESLDEYLIAAEYCCTYRKVNIKNNAEKKMNPSDYQNSILHTYSVPVTGANVSVKNGVYYINDLMYIEYDSTLNRNGCLGYPAGVLLFSIIDSIGSYFRKNNNFTIKIDSIDSIINGEGWEHFKILNSKYFNQDLSLDFIKVLYSKFRSLLTHNAILGNNAYIVSGNESILNPKLKDQAFISDKYRNIFIISIKELLNLCKIAVVEFKKDIDNVVPTSKIGKKFI